MYMCIEIYVHTIYTYIYDVYRSTHIPRTQLTSIFEGQPSKKRSFSTKPGLLGFQDVYLWYSSIGHEIRGPDK